MSGREAADGMQGVDWRAVAISLGDPITNDAEADATARDSAPVTDVGMSGVGLDRDAQEMHAMFLESLAGDDSISDVRDVHLQILSDDFEHIEETRRAVATIPSMELLVADLDGAVEGDVIRLPLRGVSVDQIGIEVGVLAGEQVVRLAIRGSRSFERFARLGLGRSLTSVWFDDGQLMLRSN